MKRTNTFAIKFRNNDEALSLAKGCTTLWNKLTYKRRQSFFSGEFDWSSQAEYDSFKGWVGSATAQQVIRKNDQAWKAFFSLLRQKKEGTLPLHIKKVKPPGYWKDRNTGEVVPRMLIRNDCYKTRGRSIWLPFKLRGRIMGNRKWHGKQGTLELRYHRGKWYAHQPVEAEPYNQPGGQKRAFVDLGVRYPITAVLDGDPVPLAYSGSTMLADWWYWTHAIARAQGELEIKNGKRTSERIRELYRKRRLRFRQSINAMVKDFVERCYRSGVRKIIAGDLTGIRDNGDSMGRKSNAMVHNFWSHRHLTERLKCTAENYGIEVKLIDERGTSSKCPRCGSNKAIKRGRLFSCKECELEAHRDAVGAINIGIAHHNGAGHTNWVMAHPWVVSNLEGTPPL